MCFHVQNSVVCKILFGITGCLIFTPFSVSRRIFTPQTLELSAVFNGQYLHLNIIRTGKKLTLLRVTDAFVCPNARIGSKY